MSDRTVDALISGAIALVVVLAVRWSLGKAFARYERRLSENDPTAAARRRTTFGFARRVIVAVVAVIGAWQVLSLYPQTDQLVSTMLASSAVLALFVGLAFSTPLSNLGSGLLVAVAQPLRIGDRVTISDHTGFVEEMSLIYTTLVTDDARRVFIPNSQLTTSTIVNRTIRDPRRAVSATFPIRLDASITDARKAALQAVASIPGTLADQSRVTVGQIAEGALWLDVTAYAPLNANVAQLTSDVREAVVGALAERKLLAA